MTTEEAEAFRQNLIERGFIMTDGYEPRFTPSNSLQVTHDVHSPIPQENGRDLPSLATQWRSEWARRVKVRSSTK